MKTKESKTKELLEGDIVKEKESSRFLQAFKHPLIKNHHTEEIDFYNIVIIGSFRKHFREIINLKKELEKVQIRVLSPKECTIKNPGSEFVIFQSDATSDHKFLQDTVFSKIRCSTFVLLANYNDYIGQAATLEIGYAIAHGISILTLNPVKDVHLKPYCRLLTDVFPFLSYLASKDAKNISKHKEYHYEDRNSI